ncbi:WD40/YVTN/BNR-like repeat-containing protein [Denitromonas ohlonensis]|uniref:Photosynthesis system II assembly factor Ycf48/Hcf136-like domain-containing protein n=2 Tax=Denitromonas TaxID=139331 RepID=A0A557REC4_9RHOO|nr:YCF48-related protein [Denitromonas ohlonensis]TVO63497.1 hypothetical protein FHP90_13515 [Denitromonas ohlonensis]TVO75374.1 hypothetical protein FHP89_13550 [Denitromonas ohlonensis]TVT70627.1 MAG: hypothetical protein FHP92_18060 [Denitromonas halophila]
MQTLKKAPDKTVGTKSMKANRSPVEDVARLASVPIHAPFNGVDRVVRGLASRALVWCAASLTLVCFQVTASASSEALAAVSRGSDPVRAERTALFDLVKYNGGFLSVGERGVVMRSKDGGKTWLGIQAPTTRTLVAIVVVNENTLVAVGHGGSIVRSDDAGQTWLAIDVPDTGGDSILGVTLLKDGRLLGFGAYGMYLVSEDQGKTWERRSVINEEFDRHISKIVESGNSLYLVGETGTVARSDDGGEHWTKLETPYQGSYFGLIALGDGDLLAYGMRGNVFRTRDGGVSWRQVPFDSKSALNGGYVTADGRVVISGNNGLVAVSDGGVNEFALQYVPEGTPVAKAMYAEDGDLVYVGYLAAGRLPPNKAPVSR